MTLSNTNQSKFLVYLQAGYGFAISCKLCNADPQQMTKELEDDVEFMQKAVDCVDTLVKGQTESLQNALMSGKSKKKMPQMVLSQRGKAKNMNPSVLITKLRLWMYFEPTKPMTDKKIYDCLIEVSGNMEEGAVWLGLKVNELTNRINEMEDPEIFKKSVNLL